MGHLIGMPCLKLNNVGAQSKKCGDFGAVAREALEERQGRDKDIDHAKSAENIYTGYQTAAELQEYSRKHIDELSEKQVAKGGRKVRSDAVVMISTVIKPPAALMNTLSKEDQNKLLDDSLTKLAEIIGKDKIKSTVKHFDEQGAHLHCFWEPMTDDGRLCAKEKFNLKFFKRLNEEMPKHLRSCGWDMIEDCKAYDAAAEKLKSEEEKAAERRSKGLTSVQYKAQAEAQKNEICEQIDELKIEKSDLEEQASKLACQIERAENALNEIQEPLADLKDIEDIDDRAKVKKHLRGSETVTLSREDYNKLKAQAAHAAAADVELRQAHLELEDKEREIKRLRSRIKWLDDKFDEHVETMGKMQVKLNELDKKWKYHEKLITKIKYWICGKGKQWEQELNALVDEYRIAYETQQKAAREAGRAYNAGQKAERQLKNVSR